MDLLKYKFKKCVLKFYDKEEKYDFGYCHNLMTELLNPRNTEYMYVFWDYDRVVGFHANITLKSKCYRDLRDRLTKKGKDKDPRVYLWMHDMDNTDQFIEWISYCKMRQECNFRRAMPDHEDSTKDSNIGAPTSPHLPISISFTE